MGTNYSEQIFQSIDTIISQRLNEVSFDKTEICEIISIDEKIMNKYLVSNGSLKYEAYSDDEDRKYLVGSKVYVRIANGDYTLRKIITGSYTTDEIPKNLYTNPFNHLVVSSKYNWITETNKLSAIAYKDKITDQAVYLSNDLTFYYSGLGQFNYIGLEFSATTGFGGTTGEFQIIIDLLDNNGVSLLTDEQLGLLTLSSKQLYGNPYYLNSNLKFQHLFNFPVGNFSDLTKVKKIKITLFTKGDFNYEGKLSPITINDLTMYFGFDSSENEMSENKVALVLDNTRSLEYTTANDKKQMSIDWRDLNSGAIYNETPNMQYPEAGKYNIYWLQYSESIGYAKKLEANDGIDIAESGTYWKTVKRTDAAVANAYTYMLSPSADWKKEQIKVIIKKVGTNDYVESNGLTFTNTEFRTETGSNKGKADTLRLTLSEGDDGIYNSYGIDNKLLYSYNLEHFLTVDYIDNTVWNKDLQKVIWKIPKNATMIKQPDGWSAQGNFYVLEVKHNTSNTDGKTIKFKLSDQFSYNKTNNTIYCEIIRYKDKNSGIKTDEYQGSITLQFGLQGTNGTGWSFNIISNQRALTNKEAGQNKMTLTATFEDSEGNPIADSNWVNKVKWSWHQTQYGASEAQKRYSMSTTVGKTIDITRNDYIDCYAIIQAKLEGWQDKNGNTIDLVAYMPIAAGGPSYYLTGASRVVYNNAGTSPSYDETAYVLYKSDHTIASKDYTYKIISPENAKRIFSINEKEGNLKPLSLLPTKIPKMALQVYDEVNKWASYVQPILVLKNGYQSKLLNEWNGTLTIDNTNNSIFSALMGAGVKNNDNTFTGVLLGAVGTEISSAKTGIYGMQSGQLRYKLDENGNFYVGTGSDNRIDFSGTTDKTLTIEAKNFTLKINDSAGANQLYLGSTANTNRAWLQFKDKVYFYSDGTATIGGWNVEADIMYKSPHRNSSGDIDNPGTGLAASGWHTNPAFWAGYTGAGNNPWEHASNRTDESGWTDHTKCYITNSGILHATGADIEGKFNINNESTLNGTKVNKINGTTITSTPDSIALKAFEQKTTINGVEQTLNAHLKLNADNINAKVSKVNNGITETMSWNLTSGSFTVKANGTQVMKVTSSGMNLRGTLDITNGATINGKVQPGNLNVAGIINAGSADIKGIVKATEISASKITSGTIDASTITVKNLNASNLTTGTVDVARIPNLSAGKITSGKLVLYNGGFLVMGNSGSGWTYHPYVSALNIATQNSSKAGGISFRDSDNKDSPGNQCAYIAYGASAWNMKNEKGDVAIECKGNDDGSSGWASSNYVRFNRLYACTRRESYVNTYWLAFGNSANNSPARIRSNGSNLCLFAAKDWSVYCGGDNAGDKIAVSSSGPSSLNVKKDLVSLEQEYKNLYQDLQLIQMYNYKYKYLNVNGNLVQDYGFIIDEIENTQNLSKYFRHYEVERLITENNTLQRIDPDNPALNQGTIISIKEWERDSYIKGLFIMIKALQYKIDELENEIKEIKQNEI